MRKGCSVIFFILFILIFPTSLFSFNLKQTILNPVFYEQAFRKMDFYNRLVKIDPQKVADYISSKQPQGSSENVSTSQISGILTSLSPQDLQTMVEKNINSYLASSAKGNSNFAVDLTGIKTSVSSKNPNANTKDLLAQIPDSYQPPQTTTRLNKYSRYFPISKILSYLGFGLAILCLVLSFVLWPSWKGRLRMSGTVLFIFGIIILIGNLILRPINPPINFVADFLNGIAHDLTVVAKNSILRFYLIEGLIMAGLGVAFWVVSFFINESAPSAETVKKIK
jgi:hypothetical protein